MKTNNSVIRHKFSPNQILFTWLTTLAVSCQVLLADLTVTLTGGSATQTSTGTITVTLGSTAAPISSQVLLSGTTEIGDQTVSGTLPGLTGSFDINFTALGTSGDTFDAVDFTGGTAAINATSTTWGVNSDINAFENTFVGQGIVYSFDFTNLVGASSIDLSGVGLQNSNDNSRINFRAGGAGTSSVLYGGGVAASNDQTVPLTQALDSGDEIAFFPSAGGQNRMKRLSFSYVPAGITPPTGLAATTDGSKVDLNWDDDLSGTLDFYTVYRSLTSGSGYAQIATSLATSDYSDTTVSTGITYYYVVTATDNVGPTESGNSAEVSIAALIQPPANLTATQGDGVVTLDWDDDASGILDFYSVYRSEISGSFVDPPIATGLASSDYSDTGVTNGVTYYYVVTATDNVVATESGDSSQVKATPFTPILTTDLYVHLDAADVPSVNETGGVVSDWLDQTANFNDAFSAVGDVSFPSGSLSESGLQGLAFGSSGKTTLSLFNSSGQDSWLDFSDGAGALPYTGFSLLVAVHADSILAGINRDVVMGSNPTVFSLRYENGNPRLFFGGSILETAGGVVQADETVVFAVNYNASTGEVEFWDSQSGTSASATIPATDFSTTTDLFLGGSVNGDQYMDGIIGEVKIYRGVMDATAFVSERNALNFKWTGLTAPVGLDAMGGSSVVELDWGDQIADSYSVYRDSVLLAQNITSSDYTDTTVTGGTTYTYHVTATKDSVESAASETSSATPYTAVSGSSLYVHLDGTVASSVVLDPPNIVFDWLDQTANVNDAFSSFGEVLYPSASLSPTSLAGLDMGADRNTLSMFGSGGQDAWLDFTDALGALPYSGFSVFVAFKADNVPTPSTTREVVLANADAIVDPNAFMMRYEGGIPRAYLGAVQVNQGAAVVDSGDTVIMAVNYDAATGDLEFWDSENGTSTTVNIPAGDFSSDGQMFLGGSSNPGQKMEGMIGEVKVYRGVLTSSAFTAEQAALSTKWLGTVSPPGFSSWITGTFANGTVTNQGPDDDDDNDGISNLMEFAIAGEDPTVSNPSIGICTSNSLSFTKRAATSGLTYAIQESTDLGDADDWTEVSSGSYVNDAGTISFGFTPGTPAKNFLRLEVTN
ncbi:MAG: fibronectin type III domain-containing protein [Roseibacillus sp.]